MKILRLANGYWVMGRDLFRGLIRVALILCLVVSCGETFYFMGELSNSYHNRHRTYYNSSNDYYSKSSTIETDEIIEDIDDYVQDTTMAYNKEEFEY